MTRRGSDDKPKLQVGETSWVQESGGKGHPTGRQGVWNALFLENGADYTGLRFVTHALNPTEI